jgi:predicted PurR-regulated permease PerM
VLAVAVYVSLAMPRLRARADAALGSDARVATLQESMDKISAYVLGQGMICLIAGVTAYLFFLVIGMPYPALLALVVLALDAVPQVGATLASIVAVAVALTVSLPMAAGVLVFFVVYQQVENFLVAPRVFARTIQITPLAAFVSVLLGAAVAGLAGAVLALPLTGAASVVIRQVRAERAGAVIS